MVAGAADLISRRGIHATSLRDVVQHTGTPRGSLAHHFPGGKQQLLEEVLRYATESVAAPLEGLMQDRGAVAGLSAFVGWWRRILESSAFEAGCPVLAAAIEPVTGDEGKEAGRGPAAQRLQELTHAAFERWQTVLAAGLRREGVPAGRARRLGVLAVASIEGTVAMCRAARSMEPLDDVQRELEAVLKDAIGEN
jgi:AcrR family transcriptional regulator